MPPEGAKRLHFFLFIRTHGCYLWGHLKYRNEKSVRLMNLAEKLDVSVNYLNRSEKVFDRNKISLMTLYEISIILGVRIDKSFEK